MKKALIALGASTLVGFFGIILHGQPDSPPVLNGKVMKVAGSFPQRTKEELMIKSEVIIKGTVKDVGTSKWSNPDFKKGENIRNILQTDVFIHVEEVFKGTPYDTQQIAVRIDKGETPTTKVTSDGYPDFSKGEEVILFLSKDNSDVANHDESYYVLTGMIQGKYEADGEGKYKSALRGLTDVIERPNFREEIEKVLEKERLNTKSVSTGEIREINKKVFGE
ncbi:hypothetical protein GTO91_06090 [Heliobacterium undosum]|uniref:Uncharacterized protein n=1 Tax=Heliomicrobium undosum TaxID=121734 RepID=A0A845L103_9FIRM|nr:hypothetical protein [Heliomicrobium undosum]MZP29276.1 hypothetical protein [Heliomicrobium undosum]